MRSTLARPSPVRTTTRITGADAIIRALEREAVSVCFGMPGGAILPLYDALARGTSVRHVLARHEQGAGHMAQGYARASGRPGVVFATSGPARRISSRRSRTRAWIPRRWSASPARCAST